MQLLTRLRRACAVGLFTLAVGVCVAPAIAVAQEAAPPVNVDTTNVSTFVVAAPVMTLIVSFIIPVIVGYFSKATWPGQVKGILDIVLNAVWGLIAAGTLADGTGAFSSAAIYTAVLGCLISLAAYAKVYKPWNLTSNPGGKLANRGIK